MGPFLSHKLMARRCLLLAVGLLAWAGAPPSTVAQARVWQRIAYPSLPIPGAEHERMNVLVIPGGRSGEPFHLRLDLQWSGMSVTIADMPRAIADATAIGVKLHTAGGKVALPEGTPRWVGVGSGGGVTWSLISIFSWGRNALDEAWFEVRAGGQVYWIEMPYGLARNPADPELPIPLAAGRNSRRPC